ncbi:MAG: hypothetical protein GY822_28470 [Deltaproteobacteria bacterium]|nr:hypothetical protein [Deltaproteobacteria bacterium]
MKKRCYASWVIVQCLTCRALVDVAQVQRVAEGVHLHCSACDAASFLPEVNTPSSLPEDRNERAEPWNPQENEAFASSPLPAGASSPSSELNSAKLDNETAVDETGAKEASLVAIDIEKANAALEKLPTTEDPFGFATDFCELLDHWDDAAAHAKLIQRAALQSSLPILGARYRAILDVNPEDVRAKAAQDQIMTQAMARMDSFGSSKSTTGNAKRWSTAAMVILTLIMSGAIWYMMLAMRNL